MMAVLAHHNLEDALIEDVSKMSQTYEPNKLASLKTKARTTVVLSLSDRVLRDVVRETDIVKLWAKLESKYVVKHKTNKNVQKKAFYAYKMPRNCSMSDHIDHFCKLAMDLENIGVNIEDEDLAVILLATLPDEYEHFSDTLLFGHQVLTLEQVKSSLLSKDMLKKMRGDNEEQVNGLFVKNKEPRETKKGKNQEYKPKASKPRFVKGGSATCFNCGQEGHFARFCKVRPNGNQGGRPRFNPSRGETSNADFATLDYDDDAHVLCVSEKDPCHDWVLDSGCSYHMTPRKELLIDYKEELGGKVLLGDNHSCRVAGRGTIKFQVQDGCFRYLKDVRYVPDLRRNLISVGALDTKGFTMIVDAGEMKIVKGHSLMLKGVKRNGLYILQGQAMRIEEANVGEEDKESGRVALWHRRLGHMSEQGMKILHKEGLLGGGNLGALGFCEHCVLGKAHRAKFGQGKHSSGGILEYVHADLWGPSRVTSLGGAKYFLSIIDDYSRRVWVVILKNKSEALQSFIDWKTQVENQTGKKVKYLRTDNGMEFCNNDFIKYCKSQGITRHHTVVYTPQQNGVAERMNRTIMNKARSMLSNSGMPHSFWAEAVTTACYLINRSPSTILDFHTPMFMWSGNKMSLEHLRTFGCVAYAHVKQGNKLEPRAIKCIMLGYPEGTKGYKLWVYGKGGPKFMYSRDVTFDESKMYCDVKNLGDEGSIRQFEGIGERVSFEVGVEHVEPSNVVRNDHVIADASGDLNEDVAEPNEGLDFGGETPRKGDPKGKAILVDTSEDEHDEEDQEHVEEAQEETQERQVPPRPKGRDWSRYPKGPVEESIARTKPSRKVAQRNGANLVEAEGSSMGYALASEEEIERCIEVEKGNGRRDGVIDEESYLGACSK